MNRHLEARREWSAGCDTEPSDILVSCGAEEALHLALGATTEPGEVVAVESPTYFGVLQAIETPGRRAMEIPTCPVAGLELDALELYLRAREAGIGLSPGPIFSPAGAYPNYVRLSAGRRWSDRTEAGLDRLASILAEG